MSIKECLFVLSGILLPKLFICFTLHCLLSLDLVTLCKYCNFHSEVYFNNNFGTIHCLLLFVQELYSKEPGGLLISPVTRAIRYMYI